MVCKLLSAAHKILLTYVDDSIIIMNNRHTQKLLDAINNYHYQHKFIIERESNNELPFNSIEMYKLPDGKLTYKHCTLSTYLG